uniref:Putative LOV domain-containing protein n=1 Tax=Coleochaete scutata TaxID=3125 RepID=A0A126X2X4_COLSC|nr:putative LOV domain-containing protein [Coleochaete scutata]
MNTVEGLETTETVVKKIHTKAARVAERAEKSLALPYDEHVSDALEKHEYNFVLTDPKLPDHPIVFASEGFCKMTGYTNMEVIGRNCRFLQGPETDRQTVMEIRDAIREERACQVQILNYTKQGKPFWNLFHMAPVYCRKTGRVIHYVGVQTPVSSAFVVSSAASTPTRLSVVDEAAPTEPLPSGGEGTGFIARGGVDASDRRGEVGVTYATVQPSAECRQRVLEAVDSVVSELTEASHGKVCCTRSAELETNKAIPGTVCSSMLLSLTKIQQSFVLADPQQPDMPIIHASDVFCALTGYLPEEVVGKNCRFLQGPDTDQESVQKLRDAIKEEKPCTVRLLNYRKDGTRFWNSLHIAPVRDSKGKVIYFVGVQLDVTAASEGTCEKGVSPRLQQMGAVGAVRVAVRSLQGAGLRRVVTPPEVVS